MTPPAAHLPGSGADLGDGAPGRAHAGRRNVLILGAILAVLVLPTLYSRDFWAHDEVRHASALRSMLEDGHWFSLHMNGRPYPDKPPVYFWYVAAFAKLLGSDGPAPFFLASGLAGFLFVLATRALAKATHHGEAVAMLAALLVLTTPLYQVLLRTTRMDLLFGAAILAGQTLLFRGYGRDRAAGAVVGGFALAALALLIKGPVGIALPLAGAVAWLAWRGRLRRFLARDTALGLGVVVAAVLAWGAGIWATEGGAYLRHVIEDQVVGRAVSASSHRGPFWFYAAVLPPAAMPWTLVPVGLSASALFGGASWRARWRARREGQGGRSYLACCAVAGLVVLSLGSGKLVIYGVPLFAPLAILASGALVRMTARGARRFGWIAGLGGIAAGGIVAVAVRYLPWDLDLPGILPMAIVLGLTGLAVVLWRGRPATRQAYVLSGGLVAVSLIAALWVAPGFDPVMSPRAQAQALVRYEDAGYAPLAYRMYGGTYTWHAGRVVPETNDRAVLTAATAKDGPVVLAMSDRHWRRLRQELPGFRVVHRQYIEGKETVLVARPPLEGDAETRDG